MQRSCSVFRTWFNGISFYCLCIPTFTLLFCLGFGQGCNPVRRKSPFFDALELIVRQAQANKTNDIVDLSKAQILAGQIFSDDPGRSSVWARVGTTATFECIPQQSQQGPHSNVNIFWRYKNMSFPANSAAVSGDRSPFYSTERRNNSLHFLIHNITMANLGDVDCVQPCADRKADGECTVASYRLRPELRAKDVFRTQMRPVRAGSLEWTFSCQTKLLCGTSLHTVIPNIIWKMNDHFVGVPDHHYMAAIYANASRFEFVHVRSINMTDATCVRSLDKEESYYESTSFVKMMWLYFYPYPLSSVECWVQPDVASGEWYVQKINNVNFND